MQKQIRFFFLLITVFLFGNNETFATSIFSDTSAWDVTDSLLFIPAYNEYCNWEQETIWGKRENLTKIENEINLVLINDSSEFVPPVLGKLTSDFGWRSNRPHYGVDIKLETGDKVVSVFEGVVRIAKFSNSYGNVVVVRHFNGLETLYAHLSKLEVKSGDAVKVGDLIGLGGNTGRSFGSHLHFEVRYLGEPINPHNVFAISDSTFALNSDEIQLTKNSFRISTHGDNHVHVHHVKKGKSSKSAKFHNVKRGETLYAISRKYNVPVAKLCKLNHISSRSTLSVGQRIKYN